jgi:hypothetical protein
MPELRRPATIQDNALRHATGRANCFLGRDRTTRPVPPETAPLARPHGGAIPAQTSRAAKITVPKPEERAP